MVRIKKIAENSLYALLVVGGLAFVSLFGKDNEGSYISFFRDSGKGIGLTLDNHGVHAFLNKGKYSNYISRYANTNLEENSELRQR